MSGPAGKYCPPLGNFPRTRMRRNRRHDWSRRLVAENRLTADDLIWPLFVHEGDKRAEPVPSMPGVDRLSPDLLAVAGGEAIELGIPVIAIFPALDQSLRSADGDEATNPDNLVCRSVRAVKKAHPGLGVMCDVALDPFTLHGQDGLVRDGYVVNDETIINGASPLVLYESEAESA